MNLEAHMATMKYVCTIEEVKPKCVESIQVCECGHPNEAHPLYNSKLAPCVDWDITDGRWIPCDCENHTALSAKIAEKRQAQRRQVERIGPGRRQIRKILYLADEYDMTPQEGAKLCGVKLGTFRVMLYRYRRQREAQKESI